MRWEFLERDLHVDCKIFQVMHNQCRHAKSGELAKFFTINGFDWVVAIALTGKHELVMANQFRFGSESMSWEMPGGCVDPGEDPVTAGVRELREETGYSGKRPQLIGACHPNPAIQNNTCYFVLVEDAFLEGAQELDHYEEIETKTFPVGEVFEWGFSGKIHHAMVINALYYFRPHWERISGSKADI